MPALHGQQVSHDAPMLLLLKFGVELVGLGCWALATRPKADASCCCAPPPWLPVGLIQHRQSHAVRRGDASPVNPAGKQRVSSTDGSGAIKAAAPLGYRSSSLPATPTLESELAHATTQSLLLAPSSFSASATQRNSETDTTRSSFAIDRPLARFSSLNAKDRSAWPTRVWQTASY